MNDYILTTTSLSEYKPIGKRTQRSHLLITSEIRKRLGDEYASLFAEPVPSVGNDIDWRCSVNGTHYKLVDLTEDKRKVATERFNLLRSEIDKLADGLIQSRSDNDKILGESLKNALKIPNDDCIYIIRSNESDQIQPVIVNWAYEIDDSQHVSDTSISKEVSPEKNKESRYTNNSISNETEEPENQRDTEFESNSNVLLIAKIRKFPHSWISLILWAILVILILFIIWLLIRPCGLNLGNSLNFCPKYSDSRIDAENKRQQYQNKIIMLERELFLLNNQCVAKRTAPFNSATPSENNTIPRTHSSANENNDSQETLVIPNDRYNSPRSSEQSDEIHIRPQTTIITENNEPNDPILNEEIENRQTQKGAEDGEMTLTLIWNNKSDLDLSLICPSKDEINYNNAGKLVESCGGYLQFDDNAVSQLLTDEPLEFVKFNTIPIGRYVAQVSLYRARENVNLVDFTLQINYQGTIRTLQGNVSEDSKIWKHEYTIESQ